MNDDLQGTVVLVHPGLTHDPAGMQNQIGVIQSADLANDDIFVSFDGQQGLYSADALLVLLPQEEFHRRANGFTGEAAEIKPLLHLDLFLSFGGENKERKAMEVAKANPLIQRFCLETLEKKIEKDIANHYGRE